MTVYKPAEDTYLVIDYLEGLKLEGKKFLDMGTGNGQIALKAADKGAEVTAADKNPEALKHAKEKAAEKGLQDKISFVESDLFEDIEGKYDVIVFNPPYLPGKEGLGDEEIWRGGDRGVASSLGDISDLEESYDLEVVEDKELWFERLVLFRFG
ncbi:MAG: HemK2/MTQ2 family protein methyltransferase [Candidatus Nanohalobium sp.]